MNKTLQQCPIKPRTKQSPLQSSNPSSFLSWSPVPTPRPPNCSITHSIYIRYLTIPWRTVFFHISSFSKLSSQPLMLLVLLLVKPYSFQWKPFLTHSMTCGCLPSSFPLPCMFLSLSFMEKSWPQNSWYFRKIVNRILGICEHSELSTKSCIHFKWADSRERDVFHWFSRETFPYNG